MKSTVTVVHEHPRLHTRHSLLLYDLHTVHIHAHRHTHRTSEVSSHQFIQAVELLPVFESGGMWHGPVTGTSDHWRHHRGGRGSGAGRQTVTMQKIPAECTKLQKDKRQNK